MSASKQATSTDSKKRKSRDRDSLSQSSKRAKTAQLGVAESEEATRLPKTNGFERTTTIAAVNGASGDVQLSKSQRRREKRRLENRQQEKGQKGAESHSQNEQKATSAKRDKKKKERSSRAIASKSSSAADSPAWSLSTTSGGRFIRHDPLFVGNSHGEEFLISATNLEIQVLALDTSLVVRSHHMSGLGDIVCFTVARQQDSIVYIGYEDGTVEHWHWETGNVRKTVNNKMDKKKSGRLHAMQAICMPNNEVVLFTLLRTAHHSSIHEDGHVVYKVAGQLRDLQGFGGLDYIIAHDLECIVIGRVQRDFKAEKRIKHRFDWLELPVSSKISCVGGRLIQSVGGEEKTGGDVPGVSLAIGTHEGSILLYDDVSVLFDSQATGRTPSPRTLHWHKHAVASVKFSEDGVYLISGGKESVLVLWQLNTSQRNFLPHLTSAIERIVVNPRGDRYALQMGDNSIMVLSTGELKPVANFAGLQMFPSIDASRFGGSIALHPTQPSHILLTIPPTDPETSFGASERPFLQTFDIRACRHLTRQALTRNNVTDFGTGPEGTVIHSPDVAHIAVSKDGQWLASIDEWTPPADDLKHLAADEDDVEDEQRKRKEVYLKLWRWDEGQKFWNLVTRVDAPHSRSTRGNIGAHEALGAGKVLALAASPVTNEFATVGEDLAVKIWRPRTRTRHGVVLQDGQDRDLVEWVHKRTIQLPRDQVSGDDLGEDGDEDLVPVRACLAHSGDGSILAVSVAATEAEEQMEHILDPSSGEVLRADAGLAEDEIFALAFLERYLIAVTMGDTYIWNMITGTLEHKVGRSGKTPKSGYPKLAVNHDDKTFAQSVPATKKRKARIEVYDPTKSAPVHVEEFDTPIAAILAGNGVRGYKILFDDATIRSISPASAASVTALLTEKDRVSQDAAADVTVTDLEQQMPDVEMTDWAADNVRQSIDGDAEDDRPVVRPEQLSNIFDVGPSFAMPPVKDMLQSVVKLFSRPPVAAH